MERSEPALVPEWLRTSGSLTGGGSSTHHFTSSSLHSDEHGRGNRTYKSTSNHFLNRAPSSNSNRSSISNGYTKHDDVNPRAYISFRSSHHTRDCEREKEKPFFSDHWNLPDHLSGLINEKAMLTRSTSSLPRKKNSNHSINNNHLSDGNDVILGGGSVVGSTKKAVYQKDFPSLGLEEKQKVSDIGRVSSPVLSSVVNSLPIGNSSLIGREGWTSALAEVPLMSSVGPTSIQPTPPVTPLSTAPSIGPGLNMAEALVQAPSRAHTPPEVSVTTQRLEELAIKQSRQLIPMTPSIPKALILNHPDKVKPKASIRSSESMTVTTKCVQLQPNLSLRSANIKSDSPKLSQAGKLLVLKPARENGSPLNPKEIPSTGTENTQISVGPNTSKPSTVDKKPPYSQAQSRNDFFNLMRKKTSINNRPVHVSSGPDASAPNGEKPGNEIKEVDGVAVCIPNAVDNGGDVTINGGEKNLLMTNNENEVYPDEEEAAFLRSLGWEENPGEDEGLTEEEINAFYQEYMKLRPALKLCRGLHTKLSSLVDCHSASMGDALCEPCSSDSEQVI